MTNWRVWPMVCVLCVVTTSAVSPHAVADISPAV